jgi:predicted CXXCH cytochrome family protein
MTVLQRVLIMVASVGLIAGSFASAGLDGPQLLAPADKTLVEGELLSLVVRLGGSDTDALGISVNGKEVARLPALQGKEVYCKTVKLNVGSNIIAVKAFKNGVDTHVESLSVFYRSDLSKEFSGDPAGFRRNPFHRQDIEGMCVTCHHTEPSETDVNPASPEASACFQCHKSVAAYPQVHGPVATWSCLSCHERDSKPLRYATRNPERDSCFACHVEEKNEWEAKKYVHGPTATGKCTICHNPHASDNPYWLRKPSWDLCVSCHEAKTKHRFKPFALVSGNHPTKDRRDPTKPGKMLTCASCHNSHAAASSALFAFNATNIYEFCNRCHMK